MDDVSRSSCQGCKSSNSVVLNGAEGEYTCMRCGVVQKGCLLVDSASALHFDTAMGNNYSSITRPEMRRELLVNPNSVSRTYNPDTGEWHEKINIPLMLGSFIPPSVLLAAKRGIRRENRELKELGKAPRADAAELNHHYNNRQEAQVTPVDRSITIAISVLKMLPNMNGVHPVMFNRASDATKDYVRRCFEFFPVKRRKRSLSSAQRVDEVEEEEGAAEASRSSSSGSLVDNEEKIVIGSFNLNNKMPRDMYVVAGVSVYLAMCDVNEGYNIMHICAALFELTKLQWRAKKDQVYYQKKIYAFLAILNTTVGFSRRDTSHVIVYDKQAWEFCRKYEAPLFLERTLEELVRTVLDQAWFVNRHAKYVIAACVYHLCVTPCNKVKTKGLNGKLAQLLSRFRQNVMQNLPETERDLCATFDVKLPLVLEVVQIMNELHDSCAVVTTTTSTPVGG